MKTILKIKINNQKFNNNQDYLIANFTNEINGQNFIKVIIVKIVNTISTSKNIKLVKKVLRQDRDFSTRLNYANKKIRAIWMNIVDTNYDSIEDMIDKSQELKGKTLLKFYKNISKYYDEMKRTIFQTQEDPFAKNAQSISKICHEVLLLTKFLQTKPKVKNMNIIYYDLYFTVIKTRDESDKIDNNENDYIIFNDFIDPNHFVGIEPRETIFR